MNEDMHNQSYTNCNLLKTVQSMYNITEGYIITTEMQHKQDKCTIRQEM
jgi:hypothetical protein